MGDFKEWEDPSNGRDDFKMGGGGWYPFTDYENCKDQTINHSNIYELFDLLGYQESIL